MAQQIVCIKIRNIKEALNRKKKITEKINFRIFVTKLDADKNIFWSSQKN